RADTRYCSFCPARCGYMGIAAMPLAPWQATHTVLAIFLPASRSAADVVRGKAMAHAPSNRGMFSAFMVVTPQPRSSGNTVDKVQSVAQRHERLTAPGGAWESPGRWSIWSSPVQ